MKTVTIKTLNSVGQIDLSLNIKINNPALKEVKGFVEWIQEVEDKVAREMSRKICCITTSEGIIYCIKDD